MITREKRASIALPEAVGWQNGICDVNSASEGTHFSLSGRENSDTRAWTVWPYLSGARKSDREMLANLVY
jgi:hypothetical protein